MKKTKITQGDWETENILGYPRGDRHPKVVSNGYTVCKAHGGEVAEVEATIKAISAVPEMIDALIEIERIYESAPDTSTLDTQLDSAIQKARLALKKAGCTE